MRFTYIGGGVFKVTKRQMTTPALGPRIWAAFGTQDDDGLDIVQVQTSPDPSLETIVLHELSSFTIALLKCQFNVA